MDVRLPDGTVIKDVPDGTTKAELVAKLQKNGMSVPAEWLEANQVAATAQQPAQLYEDPGFWGTLPIAAGKTFDSALDGMTQLYLAGRGEESALGGLKEIVQDKERTYKPLKDERPWATGIGEAAPYMVVPGGAGKTLGSNIVRMSMAGALPGAIEYGSPEERALRATTGAIAGASVPLAFSALKTAKAFAEPLFAKGRETIAGRLIKRVGENADDLVTRLKAGAQELIPGSKPTVAEVANSGGLAALQRAAAAANPEPYTRRAMEQSAARLNALQSIAGDDAAMAAAEAARTQAKQALYDQADNGVAPLDAYFSSLMKRGQFAGAVKRAQELANADGLDDIFFRDSSGAPVALLGKGAHFIKKALDEASEVGSQSFTGRTAAKAAGNTNQLFQDWLSKSIPEYGAAKAVYAEKSVPINRMQIGQELVNKMRPALSDYGALGRESANTYALALRNADATASRATGMPGAKLANVMGPKNMATLEAVAKDLARKANAQDLGRGVGSDTFQKIAMSNIAEQSGMPKLMGGLLSMPGVSRATRWIYQDADEQMQGLLADALLDPKKTVMLLQKAEPKLLKNAPKTKALLEQAAFRSGLLGAPVLYSPADE